MLKYVKRRILFFLGLGFIYIYPSIEIFRHLGVTKVLNEELRTPLGWTIVGMIYVAFISKRVKAKINEMPPNPFKTLFNGINSLVPVTVLGAFIQVVQDLVNKIPEIDIAKNIWTITISIAIGILLQVIDATINKKYLYDLEIDKEAHKKADLEIRYRELLKEREEL